MTIHGKVALITGASQGIGAACAAAFRRRGARLALAARSRDTLRAVGGADALVCPADLTDPEARRRVVEATLERYGSVDILINNAGVGLYAPSWSAPLDPVRAMFELNLFVPVALAALVAPHMRARRSGVIVNVSSIAGRLTLPWLTLYSATKHALSSFTDGLRMELRRDGVHVMEVCPGYVKTSFQEHVLAGRPPERLVRSRRFAVTAEECAEAIARGVEHDARAVFTPPVGRLFVWLHRLLPRVVDAQMRRLTEERAA